MWLARVLLISWSISLFLFGILLASEKEVETSMIFFACSLIVAILSIKIPYKENNNVGKND